MMILTPVKLKYMLRPVKLKFISFNDKIDQVIGLTTDTPAKKILTKILFSIIEKKCFLFHSPCSMNNICSI